MIKIHNLLREIAYPSQTETAGKGDKFLTYGPGNAFPLRLSELVQGSPTASSCISTISDFLCGEGFNNPDLEQRVINNQGLTFPEFHQVICNSLAIFSGFAFLVKYSKAGTILELYNLPFENCRLGKPDDKGVISKIFYNPYFGTESYHQQDTISYPIYSQKQEVAILQAQTPKFKGQVFWYGIRTPLNIFYPRPDYFSAEYWMETERRTGETFKNNLQGGLLQGALLQMIGDPSEFVNDPDGGEDNEGNPIQITKGEFLERVLNQFQGSDKVNALISLWSPNKESMPSLQALPTFANSDIYKAQSELATEKIMVSMKVPSILAINREGQSLGGDGNTMRSAVKLMQQRSIRPQGTLLDTYKKILSRMATDPVQGDLRITSYNPYPEINTVDSQVWAELSREERRKWIKDNTEITIFEEVIQPEPEPVIPVAKYDNLSYNSYPDKAKTNAKKALDWQNTTGNVCGGSAGKKLTERIASGEPLTMKEIRRLSNFLSKNTIFKDKTWDSSCDAVNYYAWGGSEMMSWANEKIKEIWN